MRVAHLADPHLGFARFPRVVGSRMTSNVGQNQREADVADTFRRTITRVIELRPDLVVVAGDVFHVPRPSNDAILLALREFRRLVEALPSTPVIIISGNHDVSPTGIPCILAGLAEVGVIVVEREPARLSLLGGAVSVLAVPEAPRLHLPTFDPDPAATHNVLLFHGEITGVIRGGSGMERQLAHCVTPDELRAPAWDYIAMGHYHVCHPVAPNAWYAGSIDYTSTDVWGELKEERAAGVHGVTGKGFILRDLATGEHTIHPTSPGRRHLDLEPVGCHGLGVDEINAAIRATVDAADIDDAVVRLKLLDIDRSARNSLDARVIRDYKRRALAFQLDVRTAEVAKAPSMAEIEAGMRAAIGSGRPAPKRLSDIVSSHLEKRELAVDLDRAAITRQALDYLERADPDAPVIKAGAPEITTTAKEAAAA